MDTVAARLRAARLRAGLSARALSRSLGRGPTYINQIESGARWGRLLPPLDALADIAAALGLSPEELLPPSLHGDYTLAVGPSARPERHLRGDGSPPRRLAEFQARLDEAERQREFLERALLAALRAVGHRAVPVVGQIGADGDGAAGSRTAAISETLVATARRPAAVRIEATLVPWLLGRDDLLLIDRLEPVEWWPRTGQLVVVRVGGGLQIRAVVAGDGGQVALAGPDAATPTIRWEEGEDELVGVVIGAVRGFTPRDASEAAWPGGDAFPPLPTHSSGPIGNGFGRAIALEIVNAKTLFRFDPPAARERAQPSGNSTPHGQIFFDRRLPRARRRPLMLVPAHRARGADAPALFCIGSDELRGLGIAASDLLVVDTARRWPREDDVVAAEYEGREVARLVAMHQGVITLLARPDTDADPAAYAPIVVADPQRLRVIGIAVDALPAPRPLGGAELGDLVSMGLSRTSN